MNREAWNLIKQNKNFYIHVYRRGIKVLIGMLIINGLLQLLIFYFYLVQPEPNYYETNGVTEPRQLKPRSIPNYTSVPLLEPDPPPENLERDIPQ
ncbi:MAG: phosphoesterase [Legionella sp.]|nr:phosphoesterase [Legionella sp.]